MPLAETRVTVMLDRERELFFNGNTMAAYEEKTGKFFLDTVASLYEAMRPSIEAHRKGEKFNINPMEIARMIPMKELRALIWASCHEYRGDDAVWPLSLVQIGKYIRLDNLAQMFTVFIRGQAANSPTGKDLGESHPPSAGAAESTETPPKEAATGGEPSIELPVDAFD